MAVRESAIDRRYLSSNCFGDYLTRPGIDVPTREIITFSMLVALGGCDTQVKVPCRREPRCGQ